MFLFIALSTKPSPMTLVLCHMFPTFNFANSKCSNALQHSLVRACRRQALCTHRKINHCRGGTCSALISQILLTTSLKYRVYCNQLLSLWQSKNSGKPLFHIRNRLVKQLSVFLVYAPTILLPPHKSWDKPNNLNKSLVD